MRGGDLNSIKGQQIEFAVSNIILAGSSCYRYTMNKRLIIPALILLFSACTPTPTVAPLVPTTDPSTPVTIPAIPLTDEVIPTTLIQPTATNIGAPESLETLWLQVLSPPDESVVNTSQVDVVGTAPAGAVVSVNDEILIVGNDQHFQTTEFLEEGPNLIEIVASDTNGNETSLILAVNYEP